MTGIVEFHVQCPAGSNQGGGVELFGDVIVASIYRMSDSPLHTKSVI